MKNVLFYFLVVAFKACFRAQTLKSKVFNEIVVNFSIAEKEKSKVSSWFKTFWRIVLGEEMQIKSTTQLYVPDNLLVKIIVTQKWGS